VDRRTFLIDLARGRSVIHVGFAGESRAQVPELASRPTWLHGQLATAARSLVGVDIDPEAVDRARSAGYEAFVANAEDPDALRSIGVQAELVVAGEIIEHTEHPGDLLEALHVVAAPGAQLVVTTPNASSMLNPLAAMARYELINPDHVAFYSWYTLTNLMQRHAWSVTSIATYHFPFAQEAWRGRGIDAVGRSLASVQRMMARLWPYIDFGLIAVATDRSAGQDGG
jgi:hypothetical protein